MTLNVHIQRTIAALGIASSLGFAAWAGSAIAHADEQGMIDTVNLTDIPVDDYPVCQLEDCSDVPNQEGLWLDKDTGNWYFEQGERTWLIIDNTVTVDHGTAAADGGVPGPIADLFDDIGYDAGYEN